MADAVVALDGVGPGGVQRLGVTGDHVGEIGPDVVQVDVVGRRLGLVVHLALGDPQQGLVHLDGVAGGDDQDRDETAHLRLDQVFHLHGLEHDHGLAGPYRVAFGHEHAHDGADQGSGDGDGAVELGRGGHRPMLANAGVRSRTIPAIAAGRGAGGDGAAVADPLGGGQKVGLVAEGESAELFRMHAITVRSVADRTGPQ